MLTTYSFPDREATSAATMEPQSCRKSLGRPEGKFRSDLISRYPKRSEAAWKCCSYKHNERLHHSPFPSTHPLYRQFLFPRAHLPWTTSIPAFPPPSFLPQPNQQCSSSFPCSISTLVSSSLQTLRKYPSRLPWKLCYSENLSFPTHHSSLWLNWSLAWWFCSHLKALWNRLYVLVHASEFPGSFTVLYGQLVI